MKHLSIIVPKGTAIIDTIIGSMNLFQMANGYYRRIIKNPEPLFKIDLVGIDQEAMTYNQFFSVTTTQTIDQVDRTDLIIIAGLVGNLDEQIELNRPFVDWIRTQRVMHGAEIASLCRGAFLLAETGLLNGKSCATHWITHDKFESKYPEVTLMPDNIISDDNGIYSSGGAYSFLNLLLYLVERYYGRETAIWCAKMAEIEMDRISQNQFVVFNGQKSHTDEAILKAQSFIEENYSDIIRIEQLAEHAATSLRNFIRRFKKATNNTPIEYIQRVRVEAAKKNLESTTMNIQDVIFDAGYQDDKSFRKVFKKYSGLTPIAYQKKYNREMALL